jgi:hypothetical protein
VTYKNISTQTRAKAVKVAKKTGAVTLPVTKKACTYKVKVKVTAKGDNHYKKGSKEVSFKVKVA